MNAVKEEGASSMQIRQVVSTSRAARAQWWQEQAERVLTEAGFAPYIQELILTDRSAELEVVKSLSEPMTSVALAVPMVAPQVPLVLDVNECDQLMSGKEGEQADVTVGAILREEGFHARDFARLSELPETQWRPHTNAAGQIVNHSGLLSFLQVRVSEYHWTWLGEQRDWFIQEYKLRWNLFTWNELRKRVMLFRKRGAEPSWRQANEPDMQARFFDFAESFAPLHRAVPDHPDVRRILTFPEWQRVAPAMAGFQSLYDSRFRFQQDTPLTLQGDPLVDAVREQVLAPLEKEAAPG
jgi:hypothetical protein